jgi:hypothetical protein
MIEPRAWDLGEQPSGPADADTDTRRPGSGPPGRHQDPGP